MNLNMLILFMLFSSSLFAAPPGDGGCLDTLLGAVAIDVQKDDYASAAKRLDEARPADIAKGECRKGVGRYCAVDGYSRDIPGINSKASLMVILVGSKKHVAIPGTTDYLTHEHQLEFQDSAESFAFQYNMNVQYWNEKTTRKAIGFVSMDDTRMFVDLPMEVWRSLPLNSRLRMRYLAEIAEVRTSQ